MFFDILSDLLFDMHENKIIQKNIQYNGYNADLN